MKNVQELDLAQMAHVCGGWALPRPLELDEPEDGETPASGKQRTETDYSAL